MFDRGSFYSNPVKQPLIKSVPTIWQSFLFINYLRVPRAPCAISRLIIVDIVRCVTVYRTFIVNESNLILVRHAQPSSHVIVNVMPATQSNHDRMITKPHPISFQPLLLSTTPHSIKFQNGLFYSKLPGLSSEIDKRQPSLWKERKI